MWVPRHGAVWHLQGADRSSEYLEMRGQSAGEGDEAEEKG